MNTANKAFFLGDKFLFDYLQLLGSRKSWFSAAGSTGFLSPLSSFTMHISTPQQGGLNVDAIRQLLLKNKEDQLMAYLTAKLEGVQCPVHGSLPEVELIPEPGGYSVDLVNDCCPAFTALCAAKIQ